MEQFIPQSSLHRALNHTLILFYYLFIYVLQKIGNSVDFTQRLRNKARHKMNLNTVTHI